MKLKEFRIKRGLRVSDIAKMLGVSLMSAYRYDRGDLPSAKVMARIIHETGGLVGSSDFFPENNASIVQDKAEQAQ